MKELSIEQKAKAYNDIIERLKDFQFEYRFSPFSDVIGDKFPELKESEDERIRKGLIKAVSRTFEGNKLFGTDVTREEALTWLEKQGEKKSQRMINAEAKEAMYDKPAWSEEDEYFMYDTLSNLTELKDRYGEGYGNVGNCIDWLKSLKQRIGG